MAGDKFGRWQGWYRGSSPLAEARYDEYPAAADEAEMDDGKA